MINEMRIRGLPSSEHLSIVAQAIAHMEAKTYLDDHECSDPNGHVFIVRKPYGYLVHTGRNREEARALLLADSHEAERELDQWLADTNKPRKGRK